MLTGYFGSLTASVMMLVSLMPPIGKGFESIRSIGEVLESPDLDCNEGKVKLERVQGAFQFRGLNFRYPDSDVFAVKDFSLDVPAGESIALVGHSGAGKSTVLNLVIRFLRPSSGCILLDGQDMNTIDLRPYRRFLFGRSAGFDLI